MINQNTSSMRIAKAAGVCGEQDVIAATYNAFAPLLLGGFGPGAGALADLGIAGAASVAAGGATSGTTN